MDIQTQRGMSIRNIRQWRHCDKDKPPVLMGGKQLHSGGGIFRAFVGGGIFIAFVGGGIFIAFVGGGINMAFFGVGLS